MPELAGGGLRLLGLCHSCLGCILINMYRKLSLELAFKNELGCPSIIVQTNLPFPSTLNITAWRKSGLVLLRCFALMSDTGRLSLKTVQRKQTTAASTGMSRRSVVALPWEKGSWWWLWLISGFVCEEGMRYLKGKFHFYTFFTIPFSIPFPLTLSM